MCLSANTDLCYYFLNAFQNTLFNSIFIYLYSEKQQSVFPVSFFGLSCHSFQSHHSFSLLFLLILYSAQSTNGSMVIWAEKARVTLWRHHTSHFLVSLGAGFVLAPAT